MQYLLGTLQHAESEPSLHKSGLLGRIAREDHLMPTYPQFLSDADGWRLVTRPIPCDKQEAHDLDSLQIHVHAASCTKNMSIEVGGLAGLATNARDFHRKTRTHDTIWQEPR